MALPSAGTLLSFVGTFVVGTLFLAITAHLAATYVLGDVSFSRALLVGPVPAAASVAVGGLLDPVFAPVVAIPADFLAIRWSYDLQSRLAAGLTVGHVAFSVLLAVSTVGLLTSLGVV